MAVDTYDVLKMKISAVQHEQVLEQMGAWIRNQDEGRYIMAANVHSVMECQSNPIYENVATDADLIIPDGMPLVVIGRYRGFHLETRADGPGLMLRALDISAKMGWRHYFYGGDPETIECLLHQLRSQWPWVRVAGSCSPPFRRLTNEENDQIVKQINDSQADVLWVSLGCPKQEIWMWEHRSQLRVPVMLGVGQAFDLLAGIKCRAPSWMCNLGLEWLYRLAAEPQRLWKRYLINNPWFVWMVLTGEIKARLKAFP